MCSCDHSVKKPQWYFGVATCTWVKILLLYSEQYNVQNSVIFGKFVIVVLIG